jgi:DnaJ-domain-containing protein 1
MTDYFALLGEARRPWLDPEELKSRFVNLTARVHPDRVHNTGDAERQDAHRRFTELNAAYQCLREPRERLRHLLELERGTKTASVQEISSTVAELFSLVGRLSREADACLAARNQATSPLLKVDLFEKGMALRDELNSTMADLTRRKVRLLDQMKDLNMAWESAPPVGSPRRAQTLPCGRLEHLYREYSYLERWSQQIQERLFQLSF